MSDPRINLGTTRDPSARTADYAHAYRGARIAYHRYGNDRDAKRSERVDEWAEQAGIHLDLVTLDCEARQIAGKVAG